MNPYYNTNTNSSAEKSDSLGQNYNSAIVELSSALSSLSGKSTDMNLEMTDSKSTNLGYAAYCASEISNSFNGVNSNIQQTWRTVEQFTRKIDTRVMELIQNFTIEIKKFVDSTMAHEQEIQLATTNANDLAERLLNELGL